VLAAIVRFGKPLSEVVAEFTRYPQTLINIPVSHGKDWQKIPEVAQACALAQKTLGKSGRLLIRRSGTEPVVRVMVEANDSTLCETTAQSVAAALKAHCC
jgi:phosphoglucosamine mutase